MSAKPSAQELFRASTTYDEAAISRMCGMQYVTFRPLRRFILYLFAFFMLIAAFSLCKDALSATACVVIGCFCITGRSFPAMMRAASITRALNKKFPTVSYTFSRTGISSDRQKEELPYSGLIRLVEDRTYFYLYPSDSTTYMIEKKALSSPEEFKRHIEQASGLKYTKPLSVSNFHIWAIFAVIKANREARLRAARRKQNG